MLKCLLMRNAEGKAERPVGWGLRKRWRLEGAQLHLASTGPGRGGGSK